MALTGRVIELTAIIMVVCSSLRPAIVLCTEKTLQDAKMLAFDIIKVVPSKLYLSISQLYKLQPLTHAKIIVSVSKVSSNCPRR